MSHPQLGELRGMLSAFFRLPETSPGPGQATQVERAEKILNRQLIIYEPETSAQVSFTWHVTITPKAPLKPSAKMQFIWPRFEDRDRDLAKMLGLPAPLSTVELPSHLRGIAPLPPITVCDVEDAERAADSCLTLLREVFELSEYRWLWITDLGDRQDWPRPLPKPETWPPVE